MTTFISAAIALWALWYAAKLRGRLGQKDLQLDLTSRRMEDEKKTAEEWRKKYSTLCAGYSTLSKSAAHNRECDCREINRLSDKLYGSYKYIGHLEKVLKERVSEEEYEQITQHEPNITPIK